MGRDVDMFFLATAGIDGQPTCSYKGGDPGFVKVLSVGALAFPVWDGNGMFVSLGNLSENPQVGLLFVDFAEQKRLRIDGEAALDDGPLCNSALTLGVCMNTRALMELVAINIGHDMGVLPRSMFTKLVIMAILSTFVATPLIRWLMRGEELAPVPVRMPVATAPLPFPSEWRWPKSSMATSSSSKDKI